MKITVIRGQNEIGGNIIEVETANICILLDAGKELTEVHEVDFQKILAQKHYDGIFISHYHDDHVGLLEDIQNLPPVYMGKRGYQIFAEYKRYRGVRVNFVPAAYLVNQQIIQVGDIKITPFAVDHSAFDAYSILLEAEGKSVLYTGDFRDNGWSNFEKYLEALPTNIDILITEGTTLTREGKRNLPEAELVKKIQTEIENCNNEVFVLSSATNLDRTCTLYEATHNCGRLFLQNLYMALIMATCKEEFYPNPYNFEDIKVFTFECLQGEIYDRLKNFKNKISRNNLAKENFVMCLRANSITPHYLRKLNGYRNLKGS